MERVWLAIDENDNDIDKSCEEADDQHDDVEDDYDGPDDEEDDDTPLHVHDERLSSNLVPDYWSSNIRNQEESVNYMPDYEMLVSDYSARNLSYDSDALNAVHALLMVLERHTDSSFLVGMPVYHLLDHFALWTPTTLSCRRANGFPSWSWVGWKGRVDFPFYFGALAGVSIIHSACFDDYIAVLEDRNEAVVVKAGQRTIPNTTYRTSTRIVIEFQAPTAELQVSQFAWGSPRTCEDRHSQSHAVIVDNSSAGAVLFNRSAALEPMYVLQGQTLQEGWRKSQTETVTYSAIALSADEMSWGYQFHIDDDPMSQANRRILDESGNPLFEHAPFDIEKWNGGEQYPAQACLVNIIVVKWEDNVAYRIGVGQVHVDAWKLCGATMRNIRLG